MCQRSHSHAYLWAALQNVVIEEVSALYERTFGLPLLHRTVAEHRNPNAPATLSPDVRYVTRGEVGPATPK